MVKHGQTMANQIQPLLNVVNHNITWLSIVKHGLTYLSIANHKHAYLVINKQGQPMINNVHYVKDDQLWLGIFNQIQTLSTIHNYGKSWLTKFQLYLKLLLTMINHT